MRVTWKGLLLIVPLAGLLLLLFGIPLVILVKMSFDTHTVGFIGTSDAYRFTVASYQELWSRVFLDVLLETFKLSAIACIVSLVIAYPIAYFIARTHHRLARRLILGFLVTLLFLSALVRVYSIQLSFGSVGPVGRAMEWLGVAVIGRDYTATLVVIGLTHILIPVMALILVGTIQNIDPQLEEAAEMLGVPRWRARLDVIVPLSARGCLAAFALGFALSVAAFVVPLILGQGKVKFVSNLVYDRFSSVANYPSGAAISVVMLIVTVIVLIGIGHLFRPRWEDRKHR